MNEKEAAMSEPQTPAPTTTGDGFDEAAPFVLPCGCKPYLFKAVRRDGTKVNLPIMLERYQPDTHLYDFRPKIWCVEHVKWVATDDELWKEIVEHYDGHA